MTETLVKDPPPHAWIRCVLDGANRVLRRSLLSRTTTTAVLTIPLPFQYVSTPPHPPPLPTLLSQLLFQRDATSTSLFIALPPLNPAQLRVPRQDEANDKVPVRPSIDAFEGEPGHQPGLHLLLLQPTLLDPPWPTTRCGR